MTFIANPAAQAQAANHETALLLDRCRNEHAPATTAQAAWHATRQSHFLAWLRAGGFVQDEPAKENSGMAPLLSAPQRDLYEESKFSLLRIDDAVG